MDEFIRKWGTVGGSVLLRITMARLQELTPEEMKRVGVTSETFTEITRMADDLEAALKEPMSDDREPCGTDEGWH